MTQITRRLWKGRRGTSLGVKIRNFVSNMLCLRCQLDIQAKLLSRQVELDFKEIWLEI